MTQDVGFFLENRVRLTERASVLLRFEGFNLLNHANFGLPGSSVSASNTFGIINGAGDPRIVQLGARVSF